MSVLTLRGITWDHSRAFPPLIAAAQRYGELHPGITVVWEKRTLHEFGHASLADLCARFDLIVLDHPMLGEAHDRALLLDLKPLISSGSFDEMREDATGPSLTSYVYGNNLYALPIDAATPAASSRVDLLATLGYEEPSSWQEMLALARRGLVSMPGFPADLFLNFMGLCVSLGGSIAASQEALVERDIALTAVELLRELAAPMPDEIYQWNPIAVYERMAATDDIAYCPFSYTYNNYSRAGFARHPLRFSEPVPLPDSRPVRTVLGGTGIAIAQRCEHSEAALEFAQYLQSSTCQNNVYALAGGQPARRSAWLDPTLNQIACDFFVRTLPAMERAYVRPRYPEYVGLQEQAGIPLREYLRSHRAAHSQSSAQQALDVIDVLYRKSLARAADA